MCVFSYVLYVCVCVCVCVCVKGIRKGTGEFLVGFPPSI